MAYKYVCSEAGFNCEVVIIDEEAERGRRVAEEHLATDHPEEAQRRQEVRGYLLSGSRLVV